MKYIGIFGGTFNPIHIGHMHLAEQLLAQLKLESISFIPSANPPLKSLPQVSAQHRADMVKLAIASNPKLKLDTRELERTGPSYTIDTLQSLRLEIGAETSISLLMGYDAFLGLPKWHEWQSLLDFAHIIVVNRQQSSGEPQQALISLLKTKQTATPESIIHAPAGKVYFAQITPLDVSSSQIRALLAQGKPVNKWLASNVLAYIQQHNLY